MFTSYRAAYAHSPVLTLVASATVLLVLHMVYSYIALQRKFKALGGGRAPPFRSTWIPFGIGFVLQFLKASRERKDHLFWIRNLKENANPNRPYTFEVKVIGRQTIFTADEDNIKAILATQFQDYGKGEQFRKDWHEFLGDSIFTTDGSMWHGSRQLIRPQFIKDRVSDLRVFEEHLSIMIPQFHSKNGQPVDVMELFFRFTLDAATHFLLGQSVESLITPKNRFAESFTEVQRIQSDIARMGPLNVLLPRREFRQHLKVLDEFVQPFIERTLRLTPEELGEKTKSDEGYSFLHALASFTRDRQVLRDQLMATLLAARDTTAATLTWLFYELSLQPEIVEKLRAEILGQVGRERAPTYDDLKAMRYLQHSLNETLRLYPAVPFNVRFALRDTTLPRGAGADGAQPVAVTAGTVVGYSTLAMQRRDDIYPPGEKFPPVMKFCPDRWDQWTPKSWTYIPFNGGPRICVGQPFALTEMAYTVVRVLQKFKTVENRMPEPAKEKCDIVIQPDSGIHLMFREDDA